MSVWMSVVPAVSIVLVATFAGLAFGFWSTRGTHQQTTDLGSPSPPTTTQLLPASDLTLEKVKLYSRVLQEGTILLEMLDPSDSFVDTMKRKYLEASQQEIVDMLTGTLTNISRLLPKVDLLAPPEVYGLTNHLYHSGLYCIEMVQFSKQDNAIETLGMIRNQAPEWQVRSVYEDLKEIMRSDLGSEEIPIDNLSTQTLKSRIETFVSQEERI